MPKVSWYRREKVVWFDTHGSMRNAKTAANSDFERHHREFGIDRVEVRDDENHLRFHLPRTLKRA